MAHINPAIPNVGDTNWGGPLSSAISATVSQINSHDDVVTALPGTYARGVSITDATYGATTGSADNATAIQAAINAMATAGGGIVFIPQGTFISGPLVMKTRVSLRGTGANSVLKLKSGSNAHFLTLFDGNTEQVGLVDLTIDGNKANQTTGDGVYFDNTGYVVGRGLPSPNDPLHYFSHIAIQNCKGNGWKGIGSVSHTVMDRLWVWGNDGSNYYFSSPDNQLFNCVSGNSGLEGYYIAGNSNRLVDCKAWTAGALLDINHASGFIVSGVDRVDLIGCEAQDNRNHGFSIITTTQMMMSGCRANRNGLGIEVGGVSPGSGGDGVYLQSVTNSRIDLVAYDHNSGGLKQRWGYNCGSGNDGNIVTIAIGQQVDASQPGVGSFGPGSLVSMTFLGKPVAQSSAPVASTAQTGTTYTLALADMGTIVEMNNASAITVTLPSDTTAAIPVGTIIEVCQTGAGQVTFAAGSGATLVSRGSVVKIAGQYGVASLRKRAANTWVLTGDLA